MLKTIASSLALVASLSAPVGAEPAPSFVPISRCTLVDTHGDEPLVDGVPRLFAIAAEACGVPPGASAALVELTATPSAAARIVAAPGGRESIEPTAFAASLAEGGRSTIVVPLGPELQGLLGVQAKLTGATAAVPIELALVGYFEEAVTFDGKTGFITTRPTCVPPKYKPDSLNYLQGPEPIQLPNGDVTLLVGTGRCCLGTKHWEAIFALNYPAAGRVASPRFRPLWATNDFSSQPKRKEAELGFPSALFHDGKWRVALTNTFLPFHKPNADRVARLDLLDLTTRAASSQVSNTWVKPIDPACGPIGSCPGRGSGFDPVLTLHPNGDLYVYHRDGNYSACSSGYVRHKVGANLSVQSDRHDGCVRFEGLAAAPFLISDIARTKDGQMVLLVEKPRGLGFIAEWVSTGAAAEIGLLWKPSGRVWPAPRHPKGAPWSYYVRDAAFLKDSRRTVVEPNVVVAQISDGTTYAEMADVRLGRWYLHYWAETAAVLPPTFGGPANACAFQGVHESADCSGVRGWAWDPLFPTTPISVDVLVDGKYAATVPANVLRPELVTTGRGDGRHGFAWPLPAALRDGKSHRISVRFAESPDALAGKTQKIKCR